MGVCFRLSRVEPEGRIPCPWPRKSQNRRAQDEKKLKARQENLSGLGVSIQLVYPHTVCVRVGFLGEPFHGTATHTGYETSSVNTELWISNKKAVIHGR